MVRKRTVTKMTKLREPQANGQLRTTRTTTSIPRSRKPMKMTRQQIIIIFFLNKEENKPTKKASASSSPLGPLPPLPLQPPPLTHTHSPFFPPPPWSSSPSRVNPIPGPCAALPLNEHNETIRPLAGRETPPFPTDPLPPGTKTSRPCFLS